MSLMPSVAEGDERVTLQRILEERSDRITEREVWAICKEACVALSQLGQNTPMFQQLCVTPDSIAFDSAGNICFLLLTEDPDPMFRAPECEAVGNTVKSHLFSLGMTLWLAIQYSGMCSPDLRRLLADMTGEEYEDRPDHHHVQAICERALHGMSADIICNEIAAAARWDSITTSNGKASLLSTPSSQLSARMQRAKISPSSSTTHTHSTASLPLRRSLQELSNPRGVLHSAAECLALLRETALSSITLGPAASCWKRGIGPSHVMLGEDGNVSIEDSPQNDGELLLAPEMLAGNDVGCSRLSWERAAVYNIGSLVCRCLDMDEERDDLDDETMALLMSTVRDRPTQRPGLHQLVRACDELAVGVSPGHRLVIGRMVQRCIRGTEVPTERPRAIIQRAPVVTETQTAAQAAAQPRQQAPDSRQSQSKTLTSSTHTPASNSSSNSAFRPVTSAPQTPAAARKQVVESVTSSNTTGTGSSTTARGLPDAYTSPLTHFRPIVIKSDSDTRARLNQPTLQETSRKLAERLRQIRDMPKRPPAHLAAALEASLMEEEEAEDLEQDDRQHEMRNLPVEVGMPTATEGLANTQFQLVCDPSTGLYSLLPASLQPSHTSPHNKESHRSAARLPTRPSPSRSGSGSHSSRVMVTVPKGQQHVRFRSAGFSGEERESRDSGVSTGQGANSNTQIPNSASTTGGGANSSQKHYPTPMERLLSTDSLRYQQTLTRLIHIVQKEFAFDGYMENGIEDLSLAEYIISLVNLKWATFSSAIRERYCDLYWSNELLSTLYEVVNGRPPDLSASEVLETPREGRRRLSSPGVSSSRSLEALGGASDVTGRQIVRCSSDGQIPGLGEDEDERGNAVTGREGDNGGEGQSRLNGAAIYHAATVRHFHKELAPDQFHDLPEEDLERQAQEVDQQISISRKQFQRTLIYRRKMDDQKVPKAGKQEHKIVMHKMERELDSMRAKLQLLENSKRKIEVLLGEQRGVELVLLPCLISSVKSDRLSLKDRSEELASLLQFHKQKDLESLQTGHPVALMAALFLRGAITSGFVQYFFFCYRYFLTPAQLLAFISSLVRLVFEDEGSAKAEKELSAKVLGRSTQLCIVWLSDFYSIDFQDRPELSHTMSQFVRQELLPRLPARDAALLQTALTSAQRKTSPELLYPLLSEDVRDSSASSYRLVSFPRALSRPSLLSSESRGLTSCLERRKCAEGDLYLPRVVRRADNFSLSDYSARSLAEVLTSFEQAMFQAVHPCHFLDTGTGPAPTGTPLHAWLDHRKVIAHWATAEVVTAPSQRLQTEAITRLVAAARCCADLRNFATCAALLDGLDSPRLAWAPAWQMLSAKWVTLRRQLGEAKMQLGSQRDFLLAAQTGSHLPTIPHPDAFLLHVRQTEIGSFTTTSGQVKWAKVRSVAQLVDQIRLFQQYRYETGTEDTDCVLTLRDRMDQLYQLDLDTLQAHAAIAASASASSNSPGRWAFLRRMKQKFTSGK